MIDKITLIKKNLSENEINTIARKNRLNQSIDANGFKQYSNLIEKNFNGGLLIAIDKTKNLKISGSLHKFHSFLATKKLTNFDSFTMHQAKETFIKMIDIIGFNPDNTAVTYYEIGLNFEVQKPPRTFFEAIHSIGNFDKLKLFYMSTKHKNNSQITTLTHRDYRTVYKTFDKIFEMLDNKRNPPTEKNIVRIETAHRRVEKTFLKEFCTDCNLLKIQTNFLNEWNRLNFFHDIVAPSGTHNNRRGLAKELFYNSQEFVLKKYQSQFDNLVLPEKLFRNIKAFIHDWQNEKIKYQTKKSELCTIWANAYNTEIEMINSKNNLY